MPGVTAFTDMRQRIRRKGMGRSVAGVLLVLACVILVGRTLSDLLDLSFSLVVVVGLLAGGVAAGVVGLRRRPDGER